MQPLNVHVMVNNQTHSECLGDLIDDSHIENDPPVGEVFDKSEPEEEISHTEEGLQDPRGSSLILYQPRPLAY